MEELYCASLFSRLWFSSILEGEFCYAAFGTFTAIQKMDIERDIWLELYVFYCALYCRIDIHFLIHLNLLYDKHLTHRTPSNARTTQSIKADAVEKVQTQESGNGIVLVNSVKADNTIKFKVSQTCQSEVDGCTYHKGSVGTLPGEDATTLAAQATKASRGIFSTMFNVCCRLS